MVQPASRARLLKHSLINQRLVFFPQPSLDLSLFTRLGKKTPQDRSDLNAILANRLITKIGIKKGQVNLWRYHKDQGD